MVEEAEEESKNNTRATLAMCFNYGGQREIAHAARAMLRAGVNPATIDEHSFAEYLDHSDIPPCDVVVRTSGEQRLSNFMLSVANTASGGTGEDNNVIAAASALSWV